MLNGKVRAHSLVDAVTERLEEAIFSGALAPGSRLREQVLARSLGVSRGPLREAIRRLEGRKLLQRTPNIGVRVVALSVKDITEMLQIQQVLQGLACRLAAKNMGDGDIAGLRRLLEQYTRKTGRNDDYDTRDLEFHSRIINGCGNERLSRLLHEDVNFLLRVHRARSITTEKIASTVLEDHKAIVAALARRDPAGAEQAMRHHIENARDLVQAVAESGAVAPPQPRAAPAPRRRVARARRRA